MTVSITVETHIDAPNQAVWHYVSDIATHTEWMQDAKAITFTGSKRTGVGTSFTCLTQVGKLKISDEMMVTEWVERSRISVLHKGIVEGSGTFTLQRSVMGGTDLTWEESLTFPWYLGGPAGELVGKRIFTKLWTENLQSLKARVEGPKNVNPIAFFAKRNVELLLSRRQSLWSVRLFSPTGPDFDVPDYAEGPTQYSARLNALARWLREEEPGATP